MGIFMDYFGAPAGTPFEVLAGSTSSSLTPVMAANGHGPVFQIPIWGANALGPGIGSFFDEGYGVVPSVPPGGTVFLNIRAWSPISPTWETAYFRGETGVWSQQIGSAQTPAALATPWPVHIILIPEPSTAALLGLGVALLLWRPQKRPRA